jgi:hypothetical protein
MKKQIFALALVGGLSLDFGAGALATAAPALSADQIVERNVAARGGLDAWRKVTTLSLTGQMDANKPRASRPDYHPPAVTPKKPPVAGAQPETSKPVDDPNKVVTLPYRLEMKRPHNTRLEIDFDGKMAVQIYDGTHGAKVRPYLNRPGADPYTDQELKLAAQEQELDGPLVDYARKGTKVAVEGVEPVEGHDAYKLKLTLKDGAVRHVWVDASTFLDVKIDGKRHLDGKDHAVSTYLRAYKAFNGLMIPMLNETSVEGVPGSMKLTVDKVVVNAPLDASRFAMPRISSNATSAANGAHP